MPIDLSIIVVNWNSASFLRRCLASIAACSGDIHRETIVVDNASYDGSAELVQKEYPDVRFIQSTENLGFARANNLGFTQSTGAALLFLNPDTEIIPGALQHLLEHLLNDPRIGAVGARLRNSDGTLQISCLQAFPTIWNLLLDFDQLKRMFPRWRLWGMRPLFTSIFEPDEVEMISGACLMVRREAFEQAHGFSSEYFMYAEDADLCYRLKTAGWRLGYAPDATVIHHGGASSASRTESGFSILMMREAIYRFLCSTRGKAYAQCCRISICVSALIRLATLTALYLTTFTPSRRLSLQAALRKWRLILRWTLGLKGWTRTQPIADCPRIVTQSQANTGSQEQSPETH